MNTALRQELLMMIEEDSRIREELAADGSLFEGYNPLMEQVHRKNAEQLRVMIRQDGWPGTDLVGADGEDAAWRIAQHSISEPEFMRNVLLLLKTAAEKDQAPLWQVALMEDRIRLFEGLPQIYGTSFDWDDEGQMSPYPRIENAETVDDRRAKMGLLPLKEEVARKRAEIAKSNEKPPPNLSLHRAKMFEWARLAGWKS